MIYGEQSDLDFNKSVLELAEANRRLVSTQRKHDVSLANCLLMLENNERQREFAIKSVCLF